MKRKRAVVTKVLFRFVKWVASLVKKYSDVALLKINTPTGNGYAGWIHGVLHYLRIEQASSYENVVDLASEMDRVRALLQLPLHGFLDASTLYRTFNRSPMAVWPALLGRSSPRLEQTGQAAIDSTFFERWQASSHYLRRIDRKVDTLKITFLLDTADQAILNVHCSAKWPIDARIEPPLTARKIDEIESLAADNG